MLIKTTIILFVDTLMAHNPLNIFIEFIVQIRHWVSYFVGLHLLLSVNMFSRKQGIEK